MMTKMVLAAGLLAALGVHSAKAQPFTQNEQKTCGAETCTVAFPAVPAGKVETWSNLSCNTSLAGAEYFVFYKNDVAGKQVLYAWIPGSAAPGAKYTLFNTQIGGVLSAGEKSYVAVIGPRSGTGFFLKCAATGTTSPAS